MEERSDPLLITLRTVFKFQDFCPGQREVLDYVMSGRDGVALMPTGGGKTLCFALPALLSDGLTVVVLPTLSLIQDMIERLHSVCDVVALTGAIFDRKM